MKRTTTRPAVGATAMMQEAFQEIEESFERFCLKAGLATLTEMMEAAPPWPFSGAGQPSLWADPGQDRIPRRPGRCGAPSCALARRRRGSTAELGGGRERGLAGPVGGEF